MTYHLIRSAITTTAEDVGIRLYQSYRGIKMNVIGTSYQEWGACLLFEGREGRYLWGVRAVGVTSWEGANKPATNFHVMDIRKKELEMGNMRRAIKDVRKALSGK